MSARLLRVGAAHDLLNACLDPVVQGGDATEEQHRPRVVTAPAR
ncbi:hypothetical protein [Euzebya tangerina]|nr:hypothetical protein [Euzebya tangerina]